MASIIMDEATWAALPDRTTLTGIPFGGQDYRDPGAPEFIYRWHGPLGWNALHRIPAPPRTAQDLRGAGFTFASHQQMGDGGYVYLYASQADPRLFVRVTRENAAQPQCVTLVVGRQQFDLNDWDAAATALAALEGGDDA